jgi:hypothetical protein
MNTPTFIQAVPWVPQRAKHAEWLATAAGEPTEIVWDSEHSAFATYRDVLTAMGDDAAILLEDDAVLTEGWREKIEQVIESRPDRVIRFFEMSKFERTWEPGLHERPGRGFGSNVCVYYPAGIAAQFLQWSAERAGPDEKYHDLLFGKFLHAAQIDYLLHVPSLVQHQPWTSTVMPGRSRKRQSRTFHG